MLVYTKLWKVLLDKGLKKKDLAVKAGIGQSTVVKLSKNENVNTDVLDKICRSLNCNVGDIVEFKR